MRAANRADVIAGRSKKVSFHWALVMWWKRVGRTGKNFSSIEQVLNFLHTLRKQTRCWELMCPAGEFLVNVVIDVT